MKKIFNYLLFSFILTFLCAYNVNAECTYQERKNLLSEAKNVDISLDIKELEETSTGVNTYGEEVTLTTYNYNVEFLVSGLSENLFIVYYNSLDHEENYISYSDLKDGVFSFVDENYSTLYNYHFDIYSAYENCSGYDIYSKEITKPVFNGYSNYRICSEEKMEDFKYCKKFVTKKITIDESTFIDKANEYLNSIEEEIVEENDNNVLNFLKNYYIYFLVGLLLIVVLIITLIIRKKKSEL